MSKLFRPKTMRRMVVFLAMIAPAVYLFGSFFSALTGSNGQQVFAQSEHSPKPVVSFGLVEGDISVSTGVFSEGDSPYTCSNSINVPDGTESIDILEPSTFTGSWAIRIFTYTDSGYLGTFVDNDFPVHFGIGETVTAVRFRFYFDNVLVESSSLVFNGALSFDDSVAYSDFVFGQFFAKDNFLVQWGSNAISENPYGFAPFGYFWRYLDNNVLHLSNDQAGLMAYGYIYYASHVLLFDVGFILVTFFLTFIQKVADKIGGEDHA